MKLAVMLIALVTSSFFIAKTSLASDTAPAPKLFKSALQKVKAKSTIPVLLPSKFPARIDLTAVHSVVGEGSANHYDITMYYDQDMGDAGFFGLFSARKPSNISKYKQKQISLDHNLTGYFRKRSCGGSCSPSQIQWLQNGILYTIQLELPSGVQEKQTMLSVANSAIDAGAR